MAFRMGSISFGENLFSAKELQSRLPESVYRAYLDAAAGKSALSKDAAGQIANVMKDWAVSLGATHFTHWFQPLNEVSAGKHDAFLAPDPEGGAILEFSAKELIMGEPDASSFPSGGLRATFEARGYTAWDLNSPVFVFDRTLYIPSVFCSYTGEALDKKTPLLRSMEALDRQAVRVLHALGQREVSHVTPMVGPEQEYFLIDRELYEKRMDLLICGRTLFGSKPPKGQEMEDHYYGRLRLRVSAFMHELDQELWRLGVFAKTKHNEVAPAQHELAVVYDRANIACDHNQLVMEVMRRVAKKHGLACLLHEKPFAGVCGSGKHINWSLATDTGKNLLDPGAHPAENLSFALFMAALIAGVDEYQDLIRYSCANVGNDDRLGSSEAPPSIVSLYLGEDLAEFFTALGNGKTPASEVKNVHLDLSAGLDFERDHTDRNRTSPCAFTGNKMEFRMCGSSASISRPTFIINTIVAKELSDIAQKLEQAAGDKQTLAWEIVRTICRDHARILYNGDNYSESWVKEAAARGLENHPTGVDAIPCVLREKNLKLFEDQKVLTRTETVSRASVHFELYSKTRNIESRIMEEMARRSILPCAMRYCGTLAHDHNEIASAGGDASAQAEELKRITALVKDARAALSALEREHAAAMKETDEEDRARAFCGRVIREMDALRRACDSLEKNLPEDLWPFPTYLDLMYRV